MFDMFKDIAEPLLNVGTLGMYGHLTKDPGLGAREAAAHKATSDLEALRNYLPAQRNEILKAAMQFMQPANAQMYRMYGSMGGPGLYNLPGGTPAQGQAAPAPPPAQHPGMPLPQIGPAGPRY